MDDEDPAIDTRAATNAWAGPLPLAILLVALFVLGLAALAAVLIRTAG